MADNTVKAVVNPQSALDRDGFTVLLTISDLEDAPLTVGAQVAHQADSVAADVAAMVVDFNALLAKLQAAGVMASS